ncbi:hypothetical protein CPB86DRAFT_812019 [Serendipita vermifera]|nr:hypothetical protein CPB86DRAFT_812019 [Serendipita vermifera]
MPPKRTHSQANRGSSPTPSTSKRKDNSTTYEQVTDNLIAGTQIVESMSGATDLLSPLKGACKLIRTILETARPYIDQVQGSGNLTDANQDLILPLKTYAENLQYIQESIVKAIEVRRSGPKKFLRKISDVQIEAKVIKKHNQELGRQFQHFSTSIDAYLATHIQEISETMHNIDRHMNTVDRNVNAIDQNVKAIAPSVTASALHNLGRASASGNVHQLCLQGTRVAIIQAIRDWAENKGEGGEKPIFWLRDIAGSGKSTVALTMAKEWKDRSLLAGEFFFSISDAEISGTKNFCSVIARDIHAYCPHLRSEIERVSTEDTAVSTRRFEEQFDKLILKPLQSNQRPLILVIDAVDECALKERKILLEILVARSPHLKLKIFLTSRPEPDISTAIAGSAIVHSMEFRLHGVEYSYNVEDIKQYIRHHLSDDLSEEQCQGLVGRAEGLFIWASTAHQEFLNSDETVKDIFTRLMSPKVANNLDSLYLSILERAAVVAGSEELMCRVLGVLASSFEPISVSMLETFVPMRAEKLVQRLASVIKVNGKDGLILFRHPTFREFLLRPHTGKYLIDIPKTHNSMTRTCLESMKQKLRFNICNLESSYALNDDILDMESRIEQYISPSSNIRRGFGFGTFQQYHMRKNYGIQYKNS